MCDSLLWVETCLDSKHACETDCVLLGGSGGMPPRKVWKKYLLTIGFWQLADYTTLLFKIS